MEVAMRILTSLFAAILLLIVGCSEKATNPPLPESAPPTAGEVPADVAGILEANSPVELDVAGSDEVDWATWPSPEWVRNSDVYAVTFVWGSLVNSVTPGVPVTDWSGTLSVNGVALVHPHRTINFERGQDSLVATDNPSVAAWVSQTGVDFDGISFLVFLRRDVEYFAAPWLTFDTPPIKLEFPFEKLVKLDAFYDVGQSRAVAVHARKIWPGRCPGGFTEGRWIKADNTGMKGTMEGLWRDFLGRPIGYIRGQFYVNDNGERVFDGYVTGYMLDYIICEFKGTWWYDDARLCPMPICGTGHGWFRGHYVYSNGTNRGGMMAGEIGDFQAPVASVMELPFAGIWHDFCPWVAERPNNSIDK
jgi:hypothetical protein